MAVKVIVINEEDVSKLPQDLEILVEEDFNSVDDYHLKAVIEDVLKNIEGMEMDDEVRFLTRARASEIAETVKDEYSYSGYNEFVAEKITEVADEIADDLGDNDDEEIAEEFDMDKDEISIDDDDDDSDEFDMDNEDGEIDEDDEEVIEEDEEVVNEK